MNLGKRLLLLAAICLIAPTVQAANVSVGGGIGFAPDYEGSKDYKAVPVPMADVKFDNGMFMKLFGLNLRANLLPKKNGSWARWSIIVDRAKMWKTTP